MKPPSPVMPRAIGSRAKIVARAVMRIGRSRCRPPSTTASTDAVALGAVLVDQVDQHDRVGDHDADEHQHADHRRDAHRGAGGEQQADRAGRRERDRDQQDQRLHQGAEGRDQQHEDDRDRRQHREAERGERLVLVLRRRRRFDAVAPSGSFSASSFLVSVGADRAGVVAGRLRGDRRGARAVDAGHRRPGRPPASTSAMSPSLTAPPASGRQLPQLGEGRGGLRRLDDDVALGVVEHRLAAGGAAHRLGDGLAEGGVVETGRGGLGVGPDRDPRHALRQVALHVGDVVEPRDRVAHLSRRRLRARARRRPSPRR